MSKIKGDAIIPPNNKYKTYGYMSMDDEYIYRVRKIYAVDVCYINSLVLNEARVGIIFKDKDKILDSVALFNDRDDTKQKYEALEDAIKKFQ